MNEEHFKKAKLEKSVSERIFESAERKVSIAHITNIHLRLYNKFIESLLLEETDRKLNQMVVACEVELDLTTYEEFPDISEVIKDEKERTAIYKSYKED
jgi:hypothetical protein